MALYLDAAKILQNGSNNGSLKSIVYRSNLKSSKPAIYALISECSKLDILLKEVIDHAGILEQEPKLSPLLTLLLVHDLLFAKGGIAASVGHPLRKAIDRHKSRLRSELTRARVRRRCASILALKNAVVKEKAGPASRRNQVRWARVNTIRSTVEEQLRTTFLEYRTVDNVGEVSAAQPDDKILKVDDNIPSLLALPPALDLTKTAAYQNGQLILQDKASCFPAYLLLGDYSPSGDIIDACAAPGNKTTHLAALMQSDPVTIFACEQDAIRSETLQAMVKHAGATNVVVLPRQDFLALRSDDPRYRNITHVLLDPSCSGSGILGREDLPRLVLPRNPNNATSINARSRKEEQEELADSDERSVDSQEGKRISVLSDFQTKLILHAMAFPSVMRISYSTCSINIQENEEVVARVLQNPVRAWRLLSRHEQVAGMRNWQHRGIKHPQSNTDPSVAGSEVKPTLSDTDLEACIRSWPGDEECAIGFFVACFVRINLPNSCSGQQDQDAWDGFSDHG